MGIVWWEHAVGECCALVALLFNYRVESARQPLSCLSRPRYSHPPSCPPASATAGAAQVLIPGLQAGRALLGRRASGKGGAGAGV
jgi:hypothetical protein